MESKTKQYYVIQDIHTGLFFHKVDEQHHVPDAPTDCADFYGDQEALGIASCYYGRTIVWGDETFCKIFIGNIQQYHRWLGRKGGSVISPKKRIANARRAKLKRKKLL